MKNWKTSLFGILSGGLMIFNAYNNHNLNPSSIGSAIAVIGAGLSAKDHNVSGE
jgi:drug/metabolite transporter (DMT)-like permease